jgi:hypothetical protein
MMNIVKRNKCVPEITMKMYNRLISKFCMCNLNNTRVHEYTCTNNTIIFSVFLLFMQYSIYTES